MRLILAILLATVVAVLATGQHRNGLNNGIGPHRNFSGEHHGHGLGALRGDAPNGGFIRSLALYTGIPMPEATDEFRSCFGRDAKAFRKDFFSVAEIVDVEEARVVLIKTTSRVSVALTTCGATDMGAFFKALHDELQSTIVGLVKDIMLIVQDAKKKNWDGVSRDLADALNYIVPLVDCPSEACHIFAGILRVLRIEALHFASCRREIEDVMPTIEAMKAAYEKKDVHALIGDLIRLLRDITGTLDKCGIPEAADVFNTQTGKIVRAVIDKIDGVERIIVDGLDITDDVFLFVKDIIDKQWSHAGMDLSKLVMDTRLAQCDEEWCKIAEAFLDSASIVFRDLAKCKAGLKTAFDLFVRGEASWKTKDYKKSVAFYGEGLIDLGEAVSICGIPHIADVVSSTGERMHSATIKQIGDDVKIIVDGIDVFVDLGHLAEHLIAQDWTAVGHDLNRIVHDLSGFHCDSEFCSLLETVLSVLGIVLPDIPHCEADVADIKQSMKIAIEEWHTGDVKSALVHIADGLDAFATGITDCGLDKVAETIIAEVAKLRKNPEIKTKGDKVVAIIVDGADLLDSIYDIVLAFETDDWNAIGRNLARLILDLTKLGCNSTACKVFEGIIKTISDFYVDLAPCKAEMETAWTSLTVAFDDVKTHDYPGAAKNFEVAILDTAHAIHTCQLDYIAADIIVVASLFHMAKVEKKAGTVVDFIVGGLSIIDDIHMLVDDYQNGDVQAVGRDIGDIIQQIRTLAHHGCETGDNSCLVFNAFLMGFHILPNLKECAGDFKESWNDIVLAMHDIGHHHSKDGVIEIGQAIHEFAAGMNECDVPELVEILIKVGSMLLGPEFAIIGEIIHILIDGIDIADDVYDIYEDFESKNWLNLGIDLVRLIKLLL